jgi:CheY-like chemotaxis protein
VTELSPTAGNASPPPLQLAPEQVFRLLVEGVTDYAIFMLDPDGHVASWNPGAERLKGYRREDHHAPARASRAAARARRGRQHGRGGQHRDAVAHARTGGRGGRARQGPIERLNAQRPDIILLDIGLPDISGYEVAREARRLPGGDRIRIYALTGYGQPEDRARTIEAGFDGHLVKPIAPADLVALVVEPDPLG